MDATILSIHAAQKITRRRGEARRIVRRSKAFVIVKGELYKKSISRVLQRCVTPQEGHAILHDIHGGTYGYHASSRAIVAKAFRA
jgi:hypothetical protein